MSRKWKRTVLILFDAFVILGAFIASYFFLFPLFPLVNIEARTFFTHLFLVITAYIVLGYFTNVFDKINRFVNIKDTLVHAAIITLAFILGSVFNLIFDTTISFRYIAFAYLISVTAIPNSRVFWRIWVDHQRRLENSTRNNNKPTRTLLIGAGDAGATFVRSLRNRPDIHVVGFLDDDPNKQGTVLYGYPVIEEIS